MEEISGVGLPNNIEQIFPPLGEGRILNELASCKNSGEGVVRSVKNTFPLVLGEVYNVLEEVSGIGQRSTNFRHSERSEESQLTSLRGGFCKIPSLPSILRNLNKTPLPNPLPRRGNQVTSPLPLGEGRILNELASCKNSGEGVTHVGQEFNDFRYAELVSASHDVGEILNSSLRTNVKQSSLCINRSRNTCAMTDNLSLRGAKRRGNPLISRLNNLKRPLSLTLSLGEGTKSLSPLLGEADCVPRLEQFCKEPKALQQNAELPFNASNQAGVTK